MPQDISHKLVIGISTRALFDLTESNNIFEKEGIEAYRKHQVSLEKELLIPGNSFNLVNKLLKINEFGEFVEVVLLSRNSADCGIRVFNSIKHYKLDISRAAFTNGSRRYPYIKAFGVDLFLSANHDDVLHTLEQGNAAATVLPTPTNTGEPTTQLRIAFDGDSVLFSDEAERIFQSAGLDAFHQNEHTQAEKPLDNGPFKGFLRALHNIQQHFKPEECPIRTALVTARSAPAHERVIKTFRQWGVRVDESFFLGGIDKAEFLKAFKADIFFDDQPGHCLSASEHVSAAHVPHGIVNEAANKKTRDKDTRQSE
jgi:5'-nucleotidase